MRPELHLPILLQLVCALHLTIALLWTLAQWRYASAHTRTWTAQVPEVGRPPTVDVLIPCFNEDPALLEACCTSLAGQDYQGRIQVFLVDDGSHNRAALRPVLERWRRRPGWQVTLLEHNRGKRRAQDVAIHQGDGELVVMVDSDTVVLPDGISRIVIPFQHRRTGAVAGNLRALNATTNLLTGLINQNYRLLFEQERAAQSHFGTVRCCCGAFSAYRRTALEPVWRSYVTQTFNGHRCTTGDDSHLTLEVLTSGYDSVFRPDARALTNVPTTARRYARQQLRWSRSFIRELGWAVRAVARRPAYAAADLAAQVLMPLLLTTAVLVYLTEVVLLGTERLLRDLLILAATAAGTSTAAFRVRDLRYLLYGPVYLTLVLPGWLRALGSPGRDSWKTRDLYA